MTSPHHFSGNILVVDDDPTICLLIESELKRMGFAVTCAHDIAGLEQAVSQKFFDAIVLDVFLGKENGLDAVPFIAAKSPYTRIISMSGEGSVELAVNAMENGVATFVTKTDSVHEIVKAVKSKVEEQFFSPDPSVSSDDYGLIGKSEAIQRVLEQIHQICNVQSNILIVGESGTGKEVVARAIHTSSERANERFAAINCSAIPENLLESELFGHRRGAFTDAKTDRKGIFEICDKGTLLLDEIGEMPLSLQVKLLRVLQEREITPLGSTQPVKIDTRIIAATNRNPVEEVKQGKFRQDLYYRLSVITIELPPLRDHKADIPELIQHFLEKMNTQHNRSIQPPNKELETRLFLYNWPGNIRELQNAIERGVVLSKDNHLHLEDMFQSLDHRVPDTSSETLMEGEIFNQSLTKAKQHFEKAYLKQLLELTHGNIAEVARISRRYRADVYRLLTKHGLEWDDFRFSQRPPHHDMYL